SPRRPSIRTANAVRSANRNGHRPDAADTNTSGPTTSVQPTGSEYWQPFSSRKNTRSSDQFCRTPTNTNSRPLHGWNGWVTRTVRHSASGSGVVDDAGQRRRRVVLLHPRTRSPVPTPLQHPSPRTSSRHRLVPRVLQHPTTTQLRDVATTNRIREDRRRPTGRGIRPLHDSRGSSVCRKTSERISALEC